MYSQAIDLKEFYDSTRGRVVQRILRQHLKALCGNVKGLRMVGFGYAAPFMRSFMPDAERCVCLMPSTQGAVFWPQDGGDHQGGLVTLCSEEDWPIETNSVDRVIVVHAMQDYDSMHRTLNEAWRVLAGQGRLILIVPNRTGLWARFDATPFGHGTPYSVGQIRQTLRDYLFVPEKAERALFVPPFSSRLMLSTAPMWERAGRRFFNAIGGVNVVEATKQLYGGVAAHAATSASLARRRVVIGTNPS